MTVRGFTGAWFVRQTIQLDSAYIWQLLVDPLHKTSVVPVTGSTKESSNSYMTKLSVVSIVSRRSIPVVRGLVSITVQILPVVVVGAVSDMTAGVAAYNCLTGSSKSMIDSLVSRFNRRASVLKSLVRELYVHMVKCTKNFS